MLDISAFPLHIDQELELHPYTRQHAVPLFRIIERDRDYLRQYQNWPDQIRTLRDMQRMIRRSLDKLQHNNGFDAVIIHKGVIVGKIGLVYIDWHAHLTEIGYWLGKEYQGHGIMTRACRAITDFTLANLNINRVQIRCAVQNARSAAIPRRLGFIDHGITPYRIWIHGEAHHETVFIMPKERWRNTVIYHITTQEAWQQAQQIGEYRAESLESQGFIHLSKIDQIVKVADAIYTGMENLVLLLVEPDSMGGDLRYEPPDTRVGNDGSAVYHDDAELFPHLYAPLPLEAVVRVIPFPPNSDGTFTLPEPL